MYDRELLKEEYLTVARKLFNKELSELNVHEVHAVIATVIKEKVIFPLNSLWEE